MPSTLQTKRTNWVEIQASGFAKTCLSIGMCQWVHPGHNQEKEFNHIIRSTNAAKEFAASANAELYAAST